MKQPALLLSLLCLAAIPALAANDPITLDLTKAELTKGVKLDATQGKLQAWKEQGASAEWLLNHIRPGQYDIQVTYAAGKSGGGKVHVTKHRNIPARSSRFGKPDRLKSMAGKTAAPAITVHQTAKKWGQFKTVTLATLQLSPGEKLRLSTAHYAWGGLWAVREVKLVPAEPK